MQGASLVAQTIKNPPSMWETGAQSLGWGDPLEKGQAKAGDIRHTAWIPGSGRPLEEGLAIRSSILAWRIPWTEEPGYSP